LVRFALATAMRRGEITQDGIERVVREDTGDARKTE
jgi:hypothetical protein